MRFHRILVWLQARLKRGLYLYFTCGGQHYNAERKTPTAQVAETRRDKTAAVVKTRKNDAKQLKKCRVRVVHLDERDGNHTTQAGSHYDVAKATFHGK